VATVLVVDDDENNRLLVKAIAAHRGHSVIEAPDAETALTLLGTERVDLVVLDLGLPGMDGAQLLRRIRAAERTRHVEVALYTATLPDAAMHDFMEMYGVRHVITKPAEAEELQLAIDNAIEGAAPPF